MTLLAPLYLYAALAVAAGVVALHCIVTRQPASAPFPTVRFVPPGQVSVRALDRPRDLTLLALRVAAVMLAGLAFARPVFTVSRVPLRRVVLLDRSASVADWTAARDSARTLLGPGDILIPFDSAPGSLSRGAELEQLQQSAANGRLTPALIAALRASTLVHRQADSLELVLISPLVAGELDAASRAVRALWPGRISIIQLPARLDSPNSSHVLLPGDREDGVVIAAALAGLGAADGSVRLRRGALQPGDSLWAAQAGHTLVHWDSNPGVPWTRRSPIDTASAVVAGHSPFVYPMAREWRVDPRPGDRVVARWIDGEPAAIEQRIGSGCLREVAIPVPLEGDLILRMPFRNLVRALLSPCGEDHSGVPLSRDALAEWRGKGALASGRAFAGPSSNHLPPQPWILALALLALMGEQWFRRRAVHEAEV